MQEFARRRRRQQRLLLFLAPFIFAAIGYKQGVLHSILGMPVQIGGWVFLALVIAVLLFSLRNWRFPAWSHYLGRALNPQHYPNCGENGRANVCNPVT